MNRIFHHYVSTILQCRSTHQQSGKLQKGKIWVKRKKGKKRLTLKDTHFIYLTQTDEIQLNFRMNFYTERGLAVITSHTRNWFLNSHYSHYSDQLLFRHTYIRALEYCINIVLKSLNLSYEWKIKCELFLIKCCNYLLAIIISPHACVAKWLYSLGGLLMS